MPDNTLQSVGQDAAAGATLGSFVPGIGTGIGALAGAAVGLSPSLFKLLNGIGQRQSANAINPVNPGYVLNQGILNNQRILSDRYNNYTLPGYTQGQGNINNTYNNAFAQGVQGASSGGDISDLAAKLAYGKSVAERQLETQNQQGKDAALTPYLEANAAAGKEYQNQNEYNQYLYQEQLANKANKTNAGATNIYSGLDTGANILQAYLNPKHIVTSLNNNNTTNAKPLGSIFSTPATQTVNTPTTASGDIDYSNLYSRYGDLGSFGGDYGDQ